MWHNEEYVPALVFCCPTYEGHIAFGYCWDDWASVPPWLIANRLRSAPVRGQSELLVIVDDLIFLISRVPEVSTLSEPHLELALVPLTLDSFSFCTGLLFTRLGQYVSGSSNARAIAL